MIESRPAAIRAADPAPEYVRIVDKPEVITGPDTKSQLAPSPGKSPSRKLAQVPIRAERPIGRSVARLPHVYADGKRIADRPGSKPPVRPPVRDTPNPHKGFCWSDSCIYKDSGREMSSVIQHCDGDRFAKSQDRRDL